MKKLVLLSMLSFFTFSNEIFAQPGRGIARSIVKKEMKKKHAEPQKEKGREAIKEATYNDKDAVVPMNQRGSATLKMEYRTYKKNGNVDEEIHSLFESSTVRSEERREGKSVDLGGGRIMKKKKKNEDKSNRD